MATTANISCRSRVWTERTPCPHTTHTHPAPYPCPLQGRPEKLSMLVSCGYHVKAPKLGGWNNRNEFSHSLEARCRGQGAAGPVPPGGTLSRACCGSQAAQGLGVWPSLHSASPCPPLHSGLPYLPASGTSLWILSPPSPRTIRSQDPSPKQVTLAFWESGWRPFGSVCKVGALSQVLWTLNC